jgi:hypothetical protein
VSLQCFQSHQENVELKDGGKGGEGRKADRNID